MVKMLVLSSFLLASITSASPASTSRCKEVNFALSGNAVNLDLSSIDPNSTSPNLTALAAGTYGTGSAASGAQTFAGWYCLPSINSPNNNRLQILRGSFFTNRESWTALGGTALSSPPLSQYQPGNYSWVDYANNLGYATLAIDALGQGASSRPDPLLVAQIPYDISLYHDLVTQIKSGSTGQLPRAYTRLIHVGNSIGSQFGNHMAASHPEDFEAMVLTGWSKSVIPSLPGVSLSLPAPAALIEPVRFLGEPLGYLTPTIEASLTNSFFGNPSIVDFDPAVAHLFFQRRDTISLGYTLTTYLPGGIVEAPKYTGRVLLLTGENDQAYCGLGSSVLTPNTQCGTLLAETGSLFPNADYNYQAIPRAGHALLLHLSHAQTLATAHSFLAGATYGKS